MCSNAADNYIEAAATVGHVLAGIPASAWPATALGDWDLRSLVGHTSRALTTVMSYLDQPAEQVDVAAPEDYYALAHRSQASSVSLGIDERARKAGRELGDEPAAKFAELVDSVTQRLNSSDLNSVIHTAGGGMTVSAYLPTRTFELVVHGIDIAGAIDQPIRFTPAILDETCQLAARIAVRIGRGVPVLQALTGRTALPAGFSVVG